MSRFGIRTRVTLLAVVPAAVIAALLAAYFTHSRIEDLHLSLRDRGVDAAHHLAAASEYALVARNQPVLDSLVRSSLKGLDVRSVAIVDRAFHMVAGGGTAPAALARLASQAGGQPAPLQQGNSVIFSAPVMLPEVDVSDPFEQPGTQPQSGTRLGTVVVELSLARTAQAGNRMLLSSLAIALLGLLLTTGIALRMSRKVTRPIRNLSMATERLGLGLLDTRVTPESSGELLILENGINAMAASLQASQEHLQARIDEATRKLTEQKEEAERANNAKSRFLAAASHDLRQPMHALGLFVGALKERIVYPEVSSIVQNIEASVTAMDSLFNALLDISRLDAGVFHPNIVDFPINRLLDRLRVEFAPQALEKWLRFKVMPCSAMVRSDPMMLERIMLNLVSNALRYTGQGGVVVGCRRHPGGLRIEVWDSGTGIPQDRLHDIFHEFVQVGNPERDRNRGLGLGLAIVERMARLLGTRVVVRSRLHRGSVFAIDVALGSQNRPARVNLKEIAAGAMHKLDLCVAVIDDEAAILDGMRVLLENWGCRVLTATSGAEVLQLLSARQHTPDLIVSDYRLRDGENGIALIRAIQAAWGATIPGVLISGDTAPERLHEAQESGFHLLHKPVSPAKLRLLITHLVNTR
jgi:signal transduction histidine kinase